MTAPLAGPRSALRALAAALVVCVAVALGSGSTARAQTTPPAAVPDERAAAAEFSFAAYDLRVAVLARRAQIRRASERVSDRLLSGRCVKAFADIPSGREDEVIDTIAFVVTGPVFDPIRPALDTFLAHLERVPTADPKLRGGRAGWRATIDLIHHIPSFRNPCARIAAWARTGFRRSAAPLDVARLDSPAVDLADRKLTVAARRMRELGVGKSAAKRFTGSNLFAGVQDDPFAA